MSDFTGIWIPAEILTIEGLELADVFLLSQVKALDNGSGCTASNSYLGKGLKCTPNRVSDRIARLEKRGFLQSTINKESGNRRTIKITIPVTGDTLYPLAGIGTNNNINTLYPVTGRPYTHQRVDPIPGNGDTLYPVTGRLYNIDYNKEDNKEDIHHDSEGENFLNTSSMPLEEKGETPTKAPPVPGAPPKDRKQTFKEKAAEAAKFVEHPFSEDELYDREKFRAYVEGKFEGIDHDYYYLKVSGWLDKMGRPPKRKVWASTIYQFLLNDYTNLKLQFKKKDTGNVSPASYPAKKSNDEIILNALKNSMIKDGDDPNEEIHPAIAKLWS